MVQASRRGSGVEYAIRDIVVKAEQVKRTGKKITYLNIGDPGRYDFETPVHIRQALTKAIENRQNYCSASEGTKELREAIAEKENKLNGAHIDASNVVITQGISEAVLFLMGAIVNPGDEVLTPGPCYPPYTSYAKFFDGTPVSYRTIEGQGWAPDLEDLKGKITERTRLIVMINPSNPTGSVYSQSEVARILEIAAARNIPVAADEIYDRIVYDTNFTSASSIAKETPIFGLNGFSKTYLMTGWRLGYLYLQDAEGGMRSIWDAIQRMARVRLCANTPVQLAGVEALRGPQDHIREMVTKLRRRRDFSLKRIRNITGFTAETPEGAFYVFPNVSAVGGRWRSDEQFASSLLEETGVVIVHGSGFDPRYGKGHFRAVFLPEESILSEAFDLMEGFMKHHA